MFMKVVPISAVHKVDAAGNKWNLSLMGFNESTGGTC